MSTEQFTLRTDEPKSKPLAFENVSTRQRVLLAGMDALPGQLDLFATDGEATEQPTAKANNHDQI